MRPALACLPPELQSAIFAFADVHDVLTLSATCTAWHRRLSDTAAPARIALRSMSFDMEGGLARLASLQLLRADCPARMAEFLHGVAGRTVPAAVVGRYITAPRDVPEEEQDARAKALSNSFLRCFDFSQDTVAQAVRRLVARTRLPPSHKLSGSLLRRLAKRYRTCHRQAAYSDMLQRLPRRQVCARALSPLSAASTAPTPLDMSAFLGLRTELPQLLPPCIAPGSCDAAGGQPAQHADGSPAAADALATAASMTPAPPPADALDDDGIPVGVQLHRFVHGLDVANADADTLYILIYCCLILNTDMRSDAIKRKMTRDDFAVRNRMIPSLTHVPAAFFHGTYDELAINGLPVADRVPISAVRHAAARVPAPEAVAILQPLVQRGAAVAGGGSSMRDKAAHAVAWLRNAVSGQLTRAAAAAAPPAPMPRREPVVTYV